MNILHIMLAPASGGAEVYVRDLCRSMASIADSVHVLFLANATEIGRSVEFQSSFLESLEEAGVKYEFIGSGARRNPMVGWRAVRKYARDNKIDIIHSHLLWGALFSISVPHIPLVHTLHSTRFRVPKVALKLLDLRASALIAISNLNHRILTSICSSPVRTIRNAIDSNRITANQGGVRKDKNSIEALFVGRFFEAKNLSFLLDAVARIENERLKLILVGEGPERKKLEARARDLGIEQRVVFKGAVNNVGAYLAEADFFVMSSAWEGLPIALIEATVAGLPVLVTNAGASAEVVHECANGFVVECGDLDGYVRALTILSGDAEVRASMARNARKFSGEFYINEATDKHLSLYRTILGEGQPRC